MIWSMLNQFYKYAAGIGRNCDREMGRFLFLFENGLCKHTFSIEFLISLLKNEGITVAIISNIF